MPGAARSILRNAWSWALALICIPLSLSFIEARPASAQDYPSGQVRIIVPLPTGGSSDLVARLLATHLGSQWKQTVIVENRVGANGLIGMTAVARAKPDGQTLLFGVPSVTTVRALIKDANVDPVKDLEGVSQVIETVYIVAINGKLPAKNAREFIAHVKANPGKLNYGTYAAGNRLVAELFNQRSGLAMEHVAYKGEQPAMAALAAGEVHMVVGTAVTMKEKAATGEIRLIAVSGPNRVASLGDVPTAQEQGITGFDPVLWFGVHAPAGTPAAVKAQIAAEIAKFVALPDMIGRLDSFGFTPKSSAPGDFQRFLEKDAHTWVDVAKSAGIDPQ